ncbi:MAG: 30S ribosomal protein S20 [Solitalea-like symbiont of Acarus siro]
MAKGKSQSSKKRVKTNLKKRLINAYEKKTIRTKMKKLRKITDQNEAVISLKEIYSSLDKLAKKNVIHKNKVARHKSHLTKYVNNLSS